MDTVFIVIRDMPHAYQEIQEVFSNYDDAAKFIEEHHPYFTYNSEHNIWTFPDNENLEMEERYYIVQKDLRN